MPISVQSKRKRNKKFKALDAHQDYDPNSDPMTDEEHDEEHVSNDEQTKLLKTQTMITKRTMNNLQLLIGISMTAMILHILIQTLSFLNLGYYYEYINSSQDFAYSMSQ